MKRKIFNGIQKTAVVLLVLFLTFTNGLSSLLLALNEVYEEHFNIVDTMWDAQFDPNVVDKFTPIERVAQNLRVPFAEAALGDARAVYGDSTIASPNQVRTRTYTGSTNSWAADATTSQTTGTTIRNEIIRYAPTRTEALAGIWEQSGSGSTLRILRWNGSTWSTEWTTTTTNIDLGNLISPFDIEYERSSGDAIVVYSTAAATTNELAYRTWNGTTWVGPTNFDVVGTTALACGVELQNRPSSDRIAMVYTVSATTNSVNAAVWNGTGWESNPATARETGALEPGLACSFKNYDIAWEETSGEILAAWGRNGITQWAYSTCTGAAPCTWAATALAGTEDGTVLDMATQPGTNNIAISVEGNAGSDMGGGFWNGASWSSTGTPDAGAGALTAGDSSVGVGWLTNGGTTKAVLIYADVAAAGVDYASVNAGVVNLTETQCGTTPPAVLERQVKVRQDPNDASKFLALIEDANSDLWAIRFVMDGAGAITCADTNGGVALNANLTSVTSQSFDFDYELFVAAPAVNLTIAVTAGSKVANVDSGAAAAFVHNTACTLETDCAAFKLTTDAGGTAVVTSIKITETNVSLDADVDLSSAALIYDSDANYSNGTTGTFASGVAFAVDDTATFTNAGITIPASSSRWFYIQLTFSNGTARPDGGLTINFRIAAVGDVVSDATEVCGTCPVSLAGTTTIRPNVTSYSNSTEPALTDGARTTQTISVAGHGFGIICNGTTAKVEIGTYILSCTGATFTDTTINIAVDSGVNVYGGTGASGNGLLVTIGSTADTPRQDFYVYPDITSLSPTAATGAKEGDTVTITGTKFRAVQGTGSVQFTNCGTTTGTIGTWADTSVTVTVPGGVLDNDDLCDILLTRDVDAKTKTSTGYTILPKIVSLAVCTGCNTDSGRTYLAGDTDGVVQLNGNHFGTAQGVNGKVEFTGGLGTATPGATIHGVVEGACGVAGWAAAGTSVCIEVTPAAIVSTVYTGSITITRNDLTTFAFSTFRVLPRIASNTLTADVVGNVIQIDGNHFCQSGTCPVSPPTAGDKVEFGATAAISTDFVTTPNCTGASKWSHTQICVKVPSGTPAGSQPTKVTSSTSFVSNTKAFTVQSTVPSNPTVTTPPERQFKANDTTTIVVGATTNETQVFLKADLSASLSINMRLQIEVQPVGTAFTCTGTNAIGVGGCAAYASGAGALEGTVLGGGGCDACTALSQAKINFTGLTDGTKHWQARARNSTTNEFSAWVSFGANLETATDFQVDTTAPTITVGPTATPSTNSVTITWTTNEASNTQVQYKANGGAADCSLNSTAITDAVPPGVTSHAPAAISNLGSGTIHWYRVLSADEAGNQLTSACASFTTTTVTQPGKTTKFYIGGKNLINDTTTLANRTFYFTVPAPETSPSVKSAYVEVIALVDGGTNPVTIQVNGVASRSYAVNSTNPTLFRFVYEIPSPNTETNLNLNDAAPCTNGAGGLPPCNKVVLTAGTGMQIRTSAGHIVVTYAYTP